MDVTLLLTDPVAYADAIQADLARIAEDPRAGMAGIAEIRRLMALFDDHFRIPDGKEPPYSCKRGCSWCCRIRVTATAAEILLVAEGLRRLPPDDLAEMRQRVATARAESTGMDHDARRLRGPYCPFLTGEGACGIYAGRPLACRSIISFSVDACKNALSGGDGEVPLSRPHMTAKSVMMLKLMGALKQRGLAWRQYELIHAMDIALNATDALAQWLAGGDPLAAATEPLDGLYAQV